jgi:hypothetical protein
VWSFDANCFRVVYYLYGELGGDAETAQRRLEDIFEVQNALWSRKPYAPWSRKPWGEYLLKDLSLLGRHEEALDLFEELMQTGWTGGGAWFRFFLYRNILLDAIRDHPRFQAMVAVFESDMAEQLENVREMERKGELPTLEEVKARIASAQENG